MPGHSSPADFESQTDKQNHGVEGDSDIPRFAVVYLHGGIVVHCEGWHDFVPGVRIQQGISFDAVFPSCRAAQWQQALLYTQSTGRPTVLSTPLGCLRSPVQIYDIAFTKEIWHGQSCIRCCVTETDIIFDCSSPDETLADRKQHFVEIAGRLSRELEKKERIERHLLELRSRNERLFGLSRDGVVLSRNHVIEAANPAFAKMLGYDSPAEVIGRSMWDIVDPAHHADINQRLEDGPEVEWIEPVQRFYVCKDGSRIHVESSASFITKGDDRIGALVVRDITERAKREEALRESEERYRSLVELSPDPIILTETDRIVMASPSARRMVGLEDDEEAIGRSVIEFVPAEYHERIAEKIALAGFGQWPEPERFEVLKGDGTRVPVEVIAHQFPNKDQFGATIIVRDISKRLAAEEAFRQSEKRWHAAIEGSQLGVWDWSPQTGERHWNSRYWQMLGYEAGEVNVASASDFAALIHPEDRLVFTGAFVAHYRGHSNYFDAEFRILCKDGSYKWVHSRGQVIERTPTGKPLRFIGTQLDIDARKQAELEIALLNELLSDRAEQLEATNRDLESFSYSVSHDLRGPLRSIDGFTAMLEQDYGHLFNEEGADGLRRVRAAAARMGELINDLLALSRVSRAEITRVPFSFSDLAEAIGREQRLSRQDRKIELIVKPGIRCCADQRLVRIVLENLIENALKFTKRREVAKIEIGVLKRDGVRTYYVRDNGAGFDSAHAGKLFQPFVRLHGPQEYEGQGIGLATVQKVVAKHGGQVSIEAEVDKGATVYLSFGEQKCSRKKCGCKISGACEFRAD